MDSFNRLDNVQMIGKGVWLCVSATWVDSRTPSCAVGLKHYLVIMQMFLLHKLIVFFFFL